MKEKKSKQRNSSEDPHPSKSDKSPSEQSESNVEQFIPHHRVISTPESKEIPWTLESEYFDYGIREWDEFYIQPHFIRKLQQMQQQSQQQLDSPATNEILTKSLNKIDQFLLYQSKKVLSEWACILEQNRSEQSINENQVIIKQQIECIQAYIQFHYMLLEELITPQNNPTPFNPLIVKKIQLSQSKMKEISQKLEKIFEQTCPANLRITSNSDQEINKYTESQEYLRIRSKFVMKQSALVAENQRLSTTLLGCVVIIPFLLNYKVSVNQIDHDIFPFYRAIFFLLAYICCFACSVWTWAKHKINYKVILSVPYQNEAPMLWISIFCTFIIGGSFWSLISPEFMNIPSTRNGITYALLLTAILGYSFVFSKIITLILDFIKGKVEFKDIFVLDQISSLSLLISDIEYYTCYNFIGNKSSYCLNSKRITRGLLLAAIPITMRTIMAIISIAHTHINPHQWKSLVGCGKYILQLVACYLNYARQSDSSLEQTWLLVQTFVAFFSFIWDTYNDWGLFRWKYFMLRERLLYKNSMFYVLGISLNFAFRFFWYINYDKQLKNLVGIGSFSPIEQVAIFGFAEILRRSIWNIFVLERIQLEHNQSNEVTNKLQAVDTSETARTALINSKNADVKKILNVIQAQQQSEFQNIAALKVFAEQIRKDEVNILKWNFDKKNS